MSLIFVKQAAEQRSYSMSGRLILSHSGWLLLTVPNAYVLGAFDTLDEPGIELPPRNSDEQQNKLRAHISVMRPDEIARIGGPDKITERGHTLHYSPGPLREFDPKGWSAMSRCWAIEVKSPELEKLRKSYGLANLPQRDGKDLPFHITVAVRRRSVLRPNAVRKAAAWVPKALLHAGGK